MCARAGRERLTAWPRSSRVPYRGLAFRKIIAISVARLEAVSKAPSFHVLMSAAAHRVGTHRNVFAYGHGHRPGNEARYARYQDRSL